MEIKHLTDVGAINQESFEDYSKSYSELGHIVMDLPLVHNLPSLVHGLIPNHYKALDLGSGDGTDSTLIQEYCRKQGKEGEFIKVDPFINQGDVLKMSMEEFVAQSQDQFDFILIKCAFHFNKDQGSFFRHCHRLLKDDGKMVIVQMGKECHLPWTNLLQQNFLNLLLLA